jgi:hypothetical protein
MAVASEGSRIEVIRQISSPVPFPSRSGPPDDEYRSDGR